MRLQLDDFVAERCHEKLHVQATAITAHQLVTTTREHQ
jgi:hypothetical protein